MTSNHTQLKHFSYMALCRMGDSPRFATLPQYTNLTEPYTYYLLTPFLSQQVAKHDVCMMEPNRYLRLMLAAKAGGLPQAGSCSFNSKYLLLIN
ncbi:MAG: hypothetical protein MJZ91_04455 [Bacteroidales bacterium]|nr:hypothetical protein [Bacteroidales bacterium]